MKNSEVLIRKNIDRRLYDTGASRYVKLDDIARMVRDGSDVRAVDGRTRKDVTQTSPKSSRRTPRSVRFLCPCNF